MNYRLCILYIKACSHPILQHWKTTKCWFQKVIFGLNINIIFLHWIKCLCLFMFRCLKQFFWTWWLELLRAVFVTSFLKAWRVWTEQSLKKFTRLVNAVLLHVLSILLPSKSRNSQTFKLILTLSYMYVHIINAVSFDLTIKRQGTCIKTRDNNWTQYSIKSALLQATATSSGPVNWVVYP